MVTNNLQSIMGYTIILQNNAERREFLLTGLKDTNETFMAYIFDDFDMPEDAPEGEYTGVLFWDGRKDVEYELNDVILDSICHTGEGDVKVRDLRPEIFLMKYGRGGLDENEYRKKNNDYIYYRK